jgi:hypothetical protein
VSTQLDFDVLARDRASRTFDHIGNSAHRSGGLVSGFGRSLVGAFAGGALYNGLKDVARGLGDMGKSAAQDQREQALLARSLRDVGGATRSQVADVETWIARAGTAYGVVDDDLRPALRRLTAATHDVGKAQDDARLAMDISADTGKSYKTVVESLAKAEGGSLTALNRLSPGLVDTKDKTATLEQATGKLADMYGGAASKAANTSAGRWDRLNVIFDETQETLGAKLLPIGLSVSDWALKDGVPAAQRLGAAFEDDVMPTLRDVADSVRDVLPELKDLGETAGRTLLPALRATADVGADLVRFFDGLPGPVKSLALEVGVAALVFPRLTGGITAAVTSARGWGTAMLDAETRTAAAASATAKLGAATRQAAGIGGMALLARGAQESNQELKTLELVGGGVATGFSVGGPVGAAVGGFAGLMAGFSSAAGQGAAGMRQMHDEAYTARAGQLDLRDALDQTTGAMTRQARQTVSQDLFNAKLSNSMSTLGVSSSDVVSAILGQEGAYKRVQAAIKQYATAGGALATDQQNAQSDASAALAGYLYNAVPKYKAAKEEILAVAAGAQTLGRALKGVPGSKAIVTRMETKGYPETARQVAMLTRGIKLTPKDLKTVIKATGADATVAQVQRVVDRINAARKTKGDLPNLKSGVARSVNEAEAVASQGGDRISRAVKRKLDQAKSTLPGLQPAIRSATSSAVGPASTGGQAVGNALEQGVVSGFASTEARLSGAARHAIAAAIAAAKAEADSHSPSKKMIKLGRDLGIGAELGLKSWGPNLSKAGASAVLKILQAAKGKIADKRNDLASALDDVAQGVKDKADELNASISARSDFAGGFQSFASSIFDAEPDKRGNYTVAGLLSYQAAQLAQAQQVQTAVDRLALMGLSPALIKQLQAKGQSGYGQILALSRGSAADISTANSQDKAISDTLSAAGYRAADAAGFGEDVVAKTRAVDLAQMIADRTAEALRDTEVKQETKIQDTAIVAIQKKRQRDRGKKNKKS